MMLESVPMVAGRLVVDRPVESVLLATSNDRQMLAAVVPAPSMNTRPATISYRAPVLGVKPNEDCTVMVGVVPAVLPTM